MAKKYEFAIRNKKTGERVFSAERRSDCRAWGLEQGLFSTKVEGMFEVWDLGDYTIDQIDI